MGGLWDRLPVTKWVYLIGALALAGIVPLSGFWSKDEILLDASNHNPLVYVLLSIAAFLTAFYIGRQILMVFFGQPRTEAARHALENPPIMTVPLIILAVLAALGGLLNLPTIAGWAAPGANALSRLAGPHPGACPAASCRRRWKGRRSKPRARSISSSPAFQPCWPWPAWRWPTSCIAAGLRPSRRATRSRAHWGRSSPSCATNGTWTSCTTSSSFARSTGSANLRPT